jgi:YHS domain-containing protein
MRKRLTSPHLKKNSGAPTDKQRESFSENIDPICEMKVKSDSKIKALYRSKTYFFCSDHCRQMFLAQPEIYLLPENSPSKSKTFPSLKTYYPLALILAYLVGGSLLIEIKSESFEGMRWMTHFMGGFFIVFSFFKLLNLREFANIYRTYDIVTQIIPVYGWIYPFLELGLGVAYTLGWSEQATHLITFVIMSLSSMGVAKSLFQKKTIECACLGTLFKLPMTKITLFEDLMMAGMALMGLLMNHLVRS